MKKKVLFVVKSKAIETLGPMYLSAVVKQAGHLSRIVEVREAVATCKSWKPDIVGFSIMTGDTDKFLTLAKQIKKAALKTVIMVGGAHPTFFPKDFEGEDDIKVIVHGEAEQIMAELLQADIKYPTDDLDCLPYPDRTDFPNRKIRDFISTRGCPFSCSYCFNQKWIEMYPELPRVRTRTVNNVIREIESVDPEFVYFQDSCFGVRIAWMREFVRQYIRRVNIPYHCHMRPSQITEEMALLLHDSGCYSLRIALETSSDKLRKIINRAHTSNQETIKAAKLLKKWDIKLMIQNMLGLPTSTIKDDLETLEVNIRCRPAYGWCSIFQPYPGTELGDMCKKRGWYKGDYSEISDSFFDSSVLDFTDKHKEQLECLQKVFALCVEVQVMPELGDLTYEGLPKFVHKAMRKMGDGRLYGGVI